MKKTPMLEKMEVVHEKSQAIGEFLDWLQETKSVHLCVMHEHTDECYEEGDSKRRFPICGWEGYTYHPTYTSTENLLAEYFEIDLEVAEKEKRALLKEIWRK